MAYRGTCACARAHTHTHTHTGILAIKNEIMPFVAMWVDPEVIILTEVSWTEKDRYHGTTYM